MSYFDPSYQTQYKKLLDKLINKPHKVGDSRIGKINSRFAEQMRIDLKKEFPLQDIKKIKFSNIVHELLWMIKGDTNIKYLVDRNVRIWNEWPYETYKASDEYQGESLEEFVEKIKSEDGFAEKWGELGPVYGKQWRRWEGPDGKTVDQITNLVEGLKNSPQSRRHIPPARQ